MADRFRVRPAESDDDLLAWNRVRRIVLPDEPVASLGQMRAAVHADRLLVLAETPDGTLVGSGVADRSSLADAFVAPRILPEHRRAGAGTAVLGILLDHIVGRGKRSVAALVDDDGSHAFAIRFGFREIDRQVEQVRVVAPGEPEPPPFAGVVFTSIAERPDLLERAYPIAADGYADMALATGPASVELDEWLRDEATLPGGSVVALVGDEVVGYAGLVAFGDDDARAENGLTVVARDWRGRGLATTMKRRQLAWASANGLREIVTWTQQGNEAMQRVNVRLGYVTRSISRTMRRELT